MQNNHNKICPFLDTNCLQDKCALFVEVQAARISPLGVGEMIPTQMCVFQAQLLVQGTPKNALSPQRR